MAWEDFYWGHIDYDDGFGSLKGGRSNPHRGLDINGHAEGTGIPAWRGGTVVFRRDWDGTLGNEITIRTSDGLRIGYCHLQAPANVQVGDTVQRGQIIGRLGNTGSASRGAHLHTTTSKSGDDPATASVEDPVPHLEAALKGNTDEMPTIGEIFNTPAFTAPDGTNLTLAQGLDRILRNTHSIYDNTPGRVWDATLPHPISKTSAGAPLPTKAGDFLRYEPVEHKSTRDAIAAKP